MKHPQHKRPIWLGLLLAALCIPLGVLIFLALPITSTPGIRVTPSSPLFFVFVGFPFSLLGVLVFGLPLVLWLRSINQLSWLAVCASAAALAAVALPLLGMAMSPLHPPMHFTDALFGAFLGLTAGAAFCVGAGPNNSFKPKPLRGSA